MGSPSPHLPIHLKRFLETAYTHFQEKYLGRRIASFVIIVLSSAHMLLNSYTTSRQPIKGLKREKEKKKVTSMAWILPFPRVDIYIFFFIYDIISSSLFRKNFI